MPSPILSSMIAAVACTMRAVTGFDRAAGDPRVYRLLCRELIDAMDDLYDELHRGGHGGRVVLGSLAIVADDEGLLHLEPRGPLPAAWWAAPLAN